MLSQVWKVLYVIGMILGIGFCVLCILMFVLIVVMVIRACVGNDDDMQPRSVSKEKESDETHLDTESELSWPDREENEIDEKPIWLIREKDGTWVRTEGKKVYMKVGDEQVW